MDEKLYKNILIYYIGHVTIKDWNYIKINSVNTLSFIFNKVKGYFEETNESNKCLTVVLTNERKEKF